jgi:exodeoxyribonuclease VII small subunit
MMSEPTNQPSTATLTRYEEALDELDSILHSIESGELGAEQLACSYRRGAELLAVCRIAIGEKQG